MTNHPQFQVSPSVSPESGSEMLLLESIRDYVVPVYELVEQIQRDVHVLKAGVAGAIMDLATLLGPIQAAIDDAAAAAEIEVVIKNLGEVAKHLLQT